VKIVLLGTAAGGGVPQWNCACRLCVAARSGSPTVPARSQDCIAVSATGRHWYLVNVSPDIRAQLAGTPHLAPGPQPRATPIRGILLTDAELDHTAGLLLLREGAGLAVWAPASVIGALSTDFPVRDIVYRYHGWTWHAIGSTAFDLGEPADGVLRCRAFPLHDKPPRYAEQRSGPWAVAYRIEDPATGGVLVYAPCLGTWPAGFDEFVTGADCVLLDGTFYSADELAPTTGGQRGMGHLPISGADGSLAALRRHPDIRWIYTHLNNTNPLLDNESPHLRELWAAGADVLVDGTELDL
jgi:pyrroloquinoline quinone biosynthesis protein B